MRKLIWLIFGILLYINQGLAQGAFGITQSNFSGINGVHYNPAYLADNKYKIYVNLVDLNVYAQNNYVKLVTPYKQTKVISGKVDSTELDTNGVPRFTSDMLVQKPNGKRKYIYAATEVTGPSIMVNLKDRSGFAFSTRLRANAYISNFDNSVMNFFFISAIDTTVTTYGKGKNEQTYSSKEGSKYKAGAGLNVFRQYTLSYAKVLKDEDLDYLTGGISVSYLSGMGAAFARLNNFNYDMPRSDSVNIKNVDIEYGYVKPEFFERSPTPTFFNYFNGEKLGKGASIDIGLNYEKRIPKEKYHYEMDKEEHEDRSMNRYLYRVGVSLVDFGSVKYNNSQYTQKVHMSGGTNVPLKWSSINGGKQFKNKAEVDSFLNTNFPKHDSSTSFKMKLPAAMHFNFDYNIGNDFYAGAQYTQSIRLRSKEGVKVRNVLYVAGRYETRKFEASFSLLFGNFYNKVQAGLFLRGGPFYIGTDNLGGFMGTRSTNGISLYTGFALAIPYKRLSDRDLDKVSDKLDKCPDEEGSVKAKGCPDKDGDGVPDAEDECPKVPGKKSTKGCPDEDNDRVWGKADKCPDKAGKKENHGCPDTDGDGLLDNKDGCPDKAGPKTNNGCPVEVAKKPEPKKEDLDFTKYDYYPVLGAFSIKENAEKFAKSFSEKTKVKTQVIYIEEKKLYYVSSGKLDSREAAAQMIEQLNRPDVNSLIMGKVWMYPKVKK